MDMLYVKGARKNLVSVGWENGTLQCEFKGGRRYHFGGVAEAVKDKLLRSPYPDHLFNQIVRGKYVSKRVDEPVKPLHPISDINYNELPF